MKQKGIKYLFVLPLIFGGILVFSPVWGSNTGTASITVTAPSSGSATVYINVDGTDHFSGSAITSNQIALTINTSATPAPTVTLTANPTSITAGNASNLTWTVTNATACTSNGTTAMPSGNWSTASSSSASTGVLNAIQTYAYGLNCTGPGGSAKSRHNRP
jgi:hypothetical protein